MADTCIRACTAARFSGRLVHGPLWAGRTGFDLGLARLTGRLSREAGHNGPALPGLPALRVAATADLLGTGRVTISAPAFETAIIPASDTAIEARTPRLAGAASHADLAFSDFGRRVGVWRGGGIDGALVNLHIRLDHISLL